MRTPIQGAGGFGPAGRWGGSLPAFSLTGAPPEFSFWGHLLKTALMLGGLLGILILGLYLFQRLRLRPGGRSLIEVLDIHHLAPRKSLILVAVARERYLLANTPESLTLVTTIPRDPTVRPGETASVSGGDGSCG